MLGITGTTTTSMLANIFRLRANARDAASFDGYLSPGTIFHEFTIGSEIRTEVPEPATGMILSLGLVALVATRRINGAATRR